LGPWLWVLQGVQAFERPIPYSGKQGLFEVARNVFDHVPLAEPPR